MSASLEGKRILVVGGTAGIGLAASRRFLADGAASLTVVGRSAARGEAACADLSGGAPVRFVRADASDPAQCEAMVAEAAEAMGAIDVLMSCGGGDPMPRLLRDIPVAELMADVTGTLAPVITPARAVLPVMSGQGAGSIICVASDAGKLATPGEVAIGAAMGAIIMFCRAMANEVKRQGIRVNCLTPSIVRGTALYDRLMADPFAGRLFGKAESAAHLGVVEPDDIAALASFLAGPESARLTGQTISVTGGISAI
jgi:NAD(P)-dependent dehydrogenase (short-subunit alcohol dehydrogenase family)